MFIETVTFFFIAPQERDGQDLNFAPPELGLSLKERSQ